MRKMKSALMTGIAVAAALTLLTADESFADSALVIDVSGACTTLDGVGSVVAVNNGDVIATHGEFGAMTLKCTVTGVTPPPDGNALRWDGVSYADFRGFPGQTIQCGFLPNQTGLIQLTDRWWVQVSASGVSTIVCQFPER